MFTLIGGIFAGLVTRFERQWTDEIETKKMKRWEECEDLREDIIGCHTGDFHKIRRPTRPPRKKHRH